MNETPDFKGGTSLSKAFNLIPRFSEDIDTTVFRGDLGEADPAHGPTTGFIRYPAEQSPPAVSPPAMGAPSRGGPD